MLGNRLQRQVIAGDGNDTLYYYNANGSVIEKITAVKNEPEPQTNFEEKVTYTYNLANRLAQIVRQYDDTGDKIEEFTQYTYNDDGIRVSKHTWSEINDTHQADDVTIVYLVDPYNHTGYAQTLEELVYNKANPDPLTETPDSLTTYLIGDDVIAQNVDGVTDYLLYDGHGSTRQLAHWTGSDITITDSYSYDGYGILLQNQADIVQPGYTSAQQTNLLYTGEYFDVDNQNYYLRSRWYNPNSGLFNRMDDFAGNTQDPQSLHKYLYVHNNPVNNIDPTGLFEFSITGLLATATIVGCISAIITGVYGQAKGWAEDKIIQWQIRAFLIGFLATAAIYAAAWTIHSIWLWLYAAQNPETARLVIGQMDDIQEVAKNEYTLIPELPNLGSVSANWAQNEAALRRVMELGRPIRDASVRSNGALIRFASDRFIEMERAFLESMGWVYNQATNCWCPPGWSG